MAKSSCSTRILNLIKKSSLKSIDKDDVIRKIQDAVLDAKKTNLDQVDVDKISKNVTEEIKKQKKINKINAVNDEIRSNGFRN